MTSKHRILWRLPDVGELRCLKKDPNKLTFWVYAFHQSKAVTHCVNLQRHKYDSNTPGFEKFVRRKIASVTDRYLEEQERHSPNLQRYELALDYLFATLGRLARKAVVS